MTLTELLKANGVADETIAKITEAMKTNKIYTSSEENIDIRYNKLKGDNDSLNKQYSEAQELIKQLKEATKGNDDIAKKVETYETTVKELETKLKEEKLANAIKVSLLSEKAVDVDYLTYKLKEAGAVELDEKENIKGWSDKLTELKKQYPNMFEASSKKNIKINKLENGNDETLTKDSILKMSYKERAELYKSDPDAFAEAMSK